MHREELRAWTVEGGVDSTPPLRDMRGCAGLADVTKNNSKKTAQHSGRWAVVCKRREGKKGIVGEVSLENSALELQNVLEETDFGIRGAQQDPSFQSGDKEHHWVASWSASGKGSTHSHRAAVRWGTLRSE